MKFEVHIVVNIRRSKLIRFTCHRAHQSYERNKDCRTVYLLHIVETVHAGKSGVREGIASASASFAMGIQQWTKGATDIFR